MKIESSARGDYTVIQVSGRADSLSTESLEQIVIQHIADGHIHLVMDFHELEYLSSSGLSLLIMAGKLSEEHGGSLTLANLSDNVREVLSVSGFIKLFTVADSVEDVVGTP